MLYEICKQEKEKYQKEKNLKKTTWMKLYSTESIVRNVISAVLEKYNLKSIIITPRLVQAFRAKLYYLCKPLTAAINCGSIKLSALLNKWKNGKHATWKIKIYFTELETYELKRENLNLRHEKRKCEDKIEEVLAKKAKIDEKLSAALKRVDNQQQTISDLKARFRRIVRKVYKTNNKRGRSKTKKYSEYSPQHKKRLINQFVSTAQTTLSFLESYDFLATKVEIYNYETDSYEVLSLVDEGVFGEKAVLDQDDLQSINMMLYVKEKFGISNQAYHELSMSCKSMPRSWKLREQVKYLNEKWDIRMTPNDKGVQQSIKDRLLIRINALKSSDPDEFQKMTSLKIKLTGDGTFIGKYIHVVNIAFTLLNEGNLAISAEGNHTIAIIRVKEDYDEL